jgi:hypothetical protein
MVLAPSSFKRWRSVLFRLLMQAWLRVLGSLLAATEWTSHCRRVTSLIILLVLLHPETYHSFRVVSLHKLLHRSVLQAESIFDRHLVRQPENGWHHEIY